MTPHIYVRAGDTWMLILDVPITRRGGRSAGYGMVGEPAKPRRLKYCLDIPIDSSKAVKAIAALLKTNITSPMFLEPRGMDYVVRVCSSSQRAAEKSWEDARRALGRLGMILEE